MDNKSLLKEYKGLYENLNSLRYNNIPYQEKKFIGQMLDTLYERILDLKKEDKAKEIDFTR